jgi:hypothetical protein
MSKIVTSVTTFNDAVGTRMSVTYSEIDDETGRIISDNKRYDRVVTDNTVKQASGVLFDYAQASLPVEQANT